MPPSRATLYNRRQSEKALQARAVLAGLGDAAVAYDDNRGFVVTRGGDRLVVGRYAVVWAWLDGYAAGVVGRSE